MINKPGKIEHYEKRFGLLAIEKGFISSEELMRAQAIQAREDIENNRYRLMGEIMFYQDIMSPGQIEEVVKVAVQ